MASFNDLYNMIYDQYREEDDPILAPPVYPDKSNKENLKVNNAKLTRKLSEGLQLSSKTSKSTIIVEGTNLYGKSNVSFGVVDNKAGKRRVDIWIIL